MTLAEPITAYSPRDALLALSGEMAEEGALLIPRVLPAAPEDFRQWEHYPKGDAIDPDSGARWFYHAHPPEQRGEGEHGHFHIFLPLSAFEGIKPLVNPVKEDPVPVVHVAGLNFDLDGLPTTWMTVNHWVTDEYIMPSKAIIARLDRVVLNRAGESKGITKVGRWLTLALQSCREDIVALLKERDDVLADIDPQDRDHEILSSRPFSFE